MGSVRLIGLLLRGLSILQAATSLTITVPRTVTAVEGSCVRVPCQTKPHTRVTWYQYHKIHYPVVYDRYINSVEKKFRGRTSVPGNSSAGDCSLIIKNIKKADNNLEIYVWINPHMVESHKFHLDTVTISVVKKAPELSSLTEIIEGETFQANCSIRHSCPSSHPSIRWIRSQNLKNPSLTTIKEEVNGEWTYMETLHGVTTHKMHHSRIRCSALFRDFTTDSPEITFNVLYKPVNVSLTLETAAVAQGDSITAECAANSNPRPHTYSWLLRQEDLEVRKVNTSQFKQAFHNMTTRTSFSCIAHNDIGAQQSDWLDLDVEYVPVILSDSSCQLFGGVMKCVCKVKAFPNASIHWSVDGNNNLSSSFILVFAYKEEFVFGKIRGPAQSEANVSCTAQNSEGSVTKQLSVHSMTQKASSYVWMILLILPGLALLLCGAKFIYRGYSKYRAQTEDTQSSPTTPERDAEVDEEYIIYDNDVVEEMRQSRAQQQLNSSTETGESEPQEQVI